MPFNLDNHGVRIAFLCSVFLAVAVLASFVGRHRFVQSPRSIKYNFFSNQAPGRCHYGTLPGHWVSSAPEGSKWQLLNEQCPLHNHLLEINSSSNVVFNDVSILLLSDSIDRYMLQFVCDYLQGVKLNIFDNDDDLPPFNSYAFHVCNSTTKLTIASAYYPGVHPTGPFHMNNKHNYTQRFSTIAKLWSQRFNRHPDMVVVSSLLWDVARLYAQDRDAVSGSELPLSIVRSWMQNFTEVLHAAQQHFPSTQLWAYHTSLPPRHNPSNGQADKPYLGKRYFVSQLNAAGITVAQQQGFEVVDYFQVGNRFQDGQTYLVDQIHFGQPLALEFVNIYLNILHQHRSQQQLQVAVSAPSSSGKPQLQPQGSKASGSGQGQQGVEVAVAVASVGGAGSSNGSISARRMLL